MPRPAIPQIRNPEGKKSQLSKENENVAGGYCGGSWPHSFELVRPWGNVNKHSKYMDALGDYDDPEKLPNPDFIARIEDALEQTWSDLDKYNDLGVIGSNDYDKIRTVLNRASTYATVAAKLDAHWAQEYAPDNLRWTDPTPNNGRPLSPVRDSEDVHWPLDEKSPWQGACGFASGDAAVMRGNAGKEMTSNAYAQVGGFYKIAFNCPSNSTIDQHIEDRKIYGRLMKAAAQNARCGQELVYALAFYELNHQEFDPLETKGLFVPLEKRKLYQEPPPRYMPGAESPPEVEEEKKSNAAILALGAAALVLLATRKR